MGIYHEEIQLEPGQSFRFLRWETDIRDVEMFRSGRTTLRLKGAGERWHYHPEAEIALISEGRGTRFVGDHIGAFESQDLVFIGPNLPHYWQGLNRSTGHVIQFDFHMNHPVWKLGECEPLGRLWKLGRRGVSFRGQTLERVSQLILEMGNTNSLGRFSMLLQILNLLNSSPAEESLLLSEKEFILPNTSSYRHEIQESIRFILEHFQDDIRMEHVLKVVHMSKPTFCRQFKKHTGKTFIQFVNEVRLDQACRLLIESAGSVSEIAFSCGFNNLSHFNRLFQKQCAMTPMIYRTQNRGE